MAHARVQIRAAVVTALTGLPTTADRVYSGRTRPLAQDHAATLLVYAIEESSDVMSQGKNAVLLRQLSLAVEGRVVMADVPDDTLDQIALEVESCLARDPTLGGLTFEVTLTSTRISTQSPGESHAGEVRMEYRVQYRTREENPEAAI